MMTPSWANDDIMMIKDKKTGHQSRIVTTIHDAVLMLKLYEQTQQAVYKDDDRSSTHFA